MKRHLTTNRLRLVVLRPESAPLTLQYYKDNKKFLEEFEAYKEENFYTELYQQAVLKAEEMAFSKGHAMRFWIFLLEDTDLLFPVGSIALSNIIRGPLQSCFVGYKMDYRYLNKGYMTEALNEIVCFAFKTLKLHRIEASVMPKNLPSLKVLEKAGFEKEGYSKDYLRINGHWEDHIRLAKINENMY